MIVASVVQLNNKVIVVPTTRNEVAHGGSSDVTSTALMV